MEQYECDKYITTPQNLKHTLNQYGVAIIPNVLTMEECEEMRSGMWDYLEHITQHLTVPINRNNPESWRSFDKLFFKHSMLLQQFSVGHMNISWKLRQNLKIVDIFALLWNVNREDLLVSFDGASFHFPPETTNKGWFRNKNWLHTDQSYTRNNLECIQSWVTANDVNAGDATLTFLEGSHLYHKDFAKKFKITDTSDWYKLQDDLQYKFYTSEKQCPRVSIKCSKGSIVFWDSRTIHMGQEPLKERLVPNIRFVIYLCYTPRNKATDESIKKKIKYFEDMRTTNHWPHKPKLFPITPQTYGAKMPKIEPILPPDVNELGRRLIGYN